MKYLYQPIAFLLLLLLKTGSLQAQTANFSANPTTVCIGQTVTFTDASTGTNIHTYSWNFGADASPATANTAGPHTVTYSSSGFKTVTLTIVDDNGTDTETKINYIEVLPNNTVTLASAPGTDNQNICHGNPITTILYNITGATGATITGLPAGVTGNWALNVVTISGTPTTPGVYNYTVNLTGGCGAVSASGSIVVTAVPAPSVSITSSESNVCIGTLVNFTATPVAPGSSPMYQWRVNGNPVGPNLPTFSYTPNNGDNVLVQMTSSLACSPGTVSSNTLTMTVSPSITPSVTISGANPVCQGINVVYNATPVNAGNNPTYQWFVNNVLQIGQTSASFAYTPANGDQVRAVVHSSACTGASANSNTIIMAVNPNVTPSVSILGPNIVCSGTPVTYTAVPVNGGPTPSYQWKVNNIDAGTNSPTFVHTPVNGDVITVVMTSSASCLSTPTATSLPITMIVNPILPVAVSITADDPDLQVCVGTSVTFTASPSNQGSTPVYQWKVNNLNVGTNSPVFTYTPANGDQVQVVLTSSEVCATGNPATSNTLTMTVQNQLIVGVLITASANNVCEGTPVTYTATPFNGGTNPQYQWKVNGINQGPPTSSATFSYVPLNGDQVSVSMTSNEVCVVSTTASSDPVVMTVNPILTPAVQIFATQTVVCSGEQVAFTTLATNGGGSPSYQWKVNNVNVGTNSPSYTYTPTDGDVVRVELTSSLSCVSAATVISSPITITVHPILPVSVSITPATVDICAGQSVEFTASAVNGGATPVFQWMVNNNTVGTNSPTFAYAPSNNDQIRVELTSSEQCKSGSPANSNIVTAVVAPSPSVNLTYTNSNTPKCEGDSIFMQTPFNAAYEYKWYKNGDLVLQGTGTGFNTYKFKLTATATIKVVVRLNDCELEDEETIVAHPLPNIQLNASAAQICSGTPLTLTLLGISGTTWNWIHPDTVANFTPITIFPIQSGDHVFSARATTFYGCTDTATVTVNVLAPPPVTITAVGGPNACTSTLKDFTATQNINYTYKWFVNGQLRPLAVTHAFSDTITGTTPVYVKVQVTNTITGCVNADSVLVTPVQAPILNMTVSKSQLCRGDQTFIVLSSPSAPPVNFAWGDGLQGNVLTRGFIPTQDTTIWAEAINATGCITRKTVNILVRDTLAFSIESSNGNSPVCIGSDVVFNAPVAPSYKYQWFVNGVAIPTAKSATFTQSFTQNSVVRVIVTDTVVGCGGSAFKNITTRVAPIFDLGPDLQVCEKEVVTINGPTGDGFTYKWFRNNELLPFSTNRVLNFTVPAGTTTLRLEASSAELCTTMDEVVITSKPIPGIILTSSNSSICATGFVDLTIQTNGATSSRWWDNFSGNINPRRFFPFGSDTTYIFWAEAINGFSCTNRDSVSVYVRPLPAVPLTVSGGSNIICYQANATITGPQAPGYQYQWFIDNQPAGTNHHELTFKVTKNVLVKLKVTDAFGCENENQVAIQSLNLPGILLQPDSLQVCQGEEFVLTINNQNVVSYAWFDGLVGNILQRSFIADQVGTSIYWAEGINAAGCLSRDTTYVTVRPNPVAQIILPPNGQVACQHTEVVLTAVQADGYTYKWFNNGTQVATTPIYTFVADTTSLIRLEVTNQFGCTKSTEVTITVNEAPVVNLGPDQSICVGYVAEFSSPTGPGITHTWLVNGIPVNGNPVYRFRVTQSITLRLEVSTPQGCFAADEMQITALPSPTINLSPDVSTICLGDQAILNLTTNGTSFIWWDGLGTNVHLRSFLPTFGDSTYVFWAEAIGANGCRSRDTSYVNVRNHPNFVLQLQGGNNTVCKGANVTFIGPQQPGYQYQWFVNNQQVPGSSHQLTQPIFQNSWIKLRVTDINGCSSADSLQMFIHTAPGIILLPDTLDVCLGSNFTLTINTQHIQSFNWWDNLAGNQTSRTFVANQLGTFIYWAEGINSIGCVSRDTAIINVRPLPQAIIQTPIGTSVCQGEVMILETATLAGNTYEWFIGGMLMDTGSIFSYTAMQSDTVSLVVTSEYGCTHTHNVFIQVNPQPQINLDPLIRACMGEEIELEAPIGPDFMYKWFVDGVLMSTDTAFNYIVADTVVIRLEVNTLFNCFDAMDILVVPLISPKLTLHASSPEICLGENVTLSANINDAVIFRWWDGFSGLTRVVTPSTAGIHHYWARVISGDNCEVYDTIQVEAHPNPVAKMEISQGAPTVCQGSEVTFSVRETSGVPVSHVIWNNTVIQPMGTDTVKFFTRQFNQTAFTRVSMVSTFGCSGVDSLQVTVQPLPAMTITADTTICAGNPLTLSVTGGFSCIWTDANGEILGLGYTLNIQPTQTRRYFATITGGPPLGCLRTDSVLVTVLPAPQVTVNASAQNVCGGTPIILTATGAESYIWSTGQTGSSITVTPGTTTVYNVIGISSNGCTGSASVTVNIIPSPQVTLSGLGSHYCLNDAPVELVGMPAGGIFSGPGVVGGQFRPQLAGPGDHMIVYSYLSPFGCIGADTVFTTVVAISASINLGPNVSICPHEQVQFDAGPGFQHYFWSTGDTTRTTIVRGNSYFPGTTRTITVVGTIAQCSALGSVNVTIRSDCYIGIGEQDDSNRISLSPNPTHGRFTINHNLPGGELLRIDVFSSQGVNVYSSESYTCTTLNPCSLDLGHLPSGVYSVLIVHKGRQYTRKLVLM
ncbi:MAG TPA: PKD domain-containing protein [Bacteroidales bacterium]|nr:PKD domain-containing protein [Bacteroidales bacterium]